MRAAAAILLGLALGGPAVPALAQGAGAAGVAGGGDALIRQQRLEEEIRRLNGRLERMEHQLRRVTEAATQRIGDLESRLFELEGGDPSLLGAPVPLGGLAADAPAGGTGQGQAPAVAVSEQTAFDAAVRRVQTGDSAGGRAALNKFLADYPDTPLKGQTRHWMAESLYLDNDYRRAAQLYLSTITEFPRASTAADSLIGLALSLEKLGQINEACLTLDEAPRRSPNNPEALARAAAEATRLGCGAPVPQQ